MEPVNQRQGFLVSAIVHLTLLMLLVSHPPSAPVIPQPSEEVSPEGVKTVFLPPPSVLRELAPAPRPQPRVPPPPTPRPEEPARTKDRISVGPPTDLRTKGPLILRREDDLTAVPKGQPDAAPPAPSVPVRTPPPSESGSPRVAGSEGLRLPAGLGRELTRGEEGSKGRPGDGEPSIASSLRKLEQRLERDSRLGLPSGTGQNLGGLFFDPQGADFTVWINHFKNEVYRNWIVPTPALLGFKGHVDFEFTVERDGTLSSLRMLKSSGTPALDRAAEKALSGSRFLPLPSDFGPARVTMQVGFYYNEGPQGT